MIHTELDKSLQSQDDGNGIYLLNYGAGNVRSLVNAVKKLGFAIKMVESCEDITVKAKVGLFFINTHSNPSFTIYKYHIS
jgi:hypothetical protein